MPMHLHFIDLLVGRSVYLLATLLKNYLLDHRENFTSRIPTGPWK